MCLDSRGIFIHKRTFTRKNPSRYGLLGLLVLSWIGSHGNASYKRRAMAARTQSDDRRRLAPRAVPSWRSRPRAGRTTGVFGTRSGVPGLTSQDSVPRSSESGHTGPCLKPCPSDLTDPRTLIIRLPRAQDRHLTTTLDKSPQQSSI